MEESSDRKYFESTKGDWLRPTIRNSLKRDCQSMCEEDCDGTDSARLECKKRKTMMKKKNVKKVMGGSSKTAKKKSSEHWLCNSCTYDYQG
ncbi:hypothetical protein D8674_029999 [Pyrus ussuriensis x Pyrus communis]|uniref:Uncharacterized protein n=1 Tax=Pyrus ussuriensis x Pyrus communis TaxID=2448454 RepID=A0A5N5I5Q3_9ROSA|nr:hypothetical protein D8674_029999 [Pyrus ussuriensis x Pyrus communis]